MITLKDYTSLLQNNLQKFANQPQVLAIPAVSPIPSADVQSGFARQNAYFFFGTQDSAALKTLRAHLLLEAVRTKRRVLIQDSGFCAYEDMQLLLDREGDSPLLHLIYNSREKLAQTLVKLAEANLSWQKCTAMDFAQHVTAQKESYDVLIVSVTEKELITRPDFAQKLAKNTNSAVIVFVETQAETDRQHPLRPLQKLGRLEDFGTEFNYVSDTSATEAVTGQGWQDIPLIEIISCAKMYSYFAVCKECHSHDGILEWYVREAE